MLQKMNFIVFLLLIYFMKALASQHPTNFLYNRQAIDNLSGFRNCTDYDYPIKLNEFGFVPYPIVVGKWFFTKFYFF